MVPAECKGNNVKGLGFRGFIRRIGLLGYIVHDTGMQREKSLRFYVK